MSKAPEIETVELHEGTSDARIVSTGEDEPTNSIDPKEVSREETMMSRLIAFLEVYDFPILICIFIGIAKLYPPLGATYLRPDITASWLSVALIFCKDFFYRACWRSLCSQPISSLSLHGSQFEV